jgi:chromate transporter
VSGIDAAEGRGSRPRAALEVLVSAGRLGLTSFGGPIAHIGYFRAEYVSRRRWLSEEEFADLVGLSQLLPGPASSQLGIAIGLLRAGVPAAPPPGSPSPRPPRSR